MLIPAAMEKPLKDIKILIVEDDPVSQEFLKEILSRKGAVMSLATTGEDAIQKFKENSDINLVLMDIRLPGQNGYEITRILKSINPSIPIIAQTAYALEGDREKALSAGCDDYISKPIKPLELLDLLLKFI